MAKGIRGADKLARQIKLLERAGPKVAKNALTDLTFTAKDGVEVHVRKALNYSSASTRQYVTRFGVRYRMRGSVFRSLIFPLRKAAEILSRHAQNPSGRRRTASDNEDVVLEGRVLIPVGTNKRDRRGRIRRRWDPDLLLEEGGRGFLNRAKTVIMERYGRKGREARPVFALKHATQNPERVDVHAAARRVLRRQAGRVFAKWLRREIRKK